MRSFRGLPLICPEWPASGQVRAYSTTRNGGVSEGPWASLNLGNHVGDDPAAVSRNRQRLADATGLPSSQFCWLNQIHGNVVHQLPDMPASGDPVCADASTTTAAGQGCIVMTADCLPVLFCDRAGSRVAAAHAGWRGLLAGVLENTLSHFDDPANVLIWLGPAIGPASFEVGPEVRQAFMEKNPAAGVCFRESHAGRYLADIYELARQRLRSAGVTNIFGGEHCTVREPETFFSYRRDGQTGRQASVIWLER